MHTEACVFLNFLHASNTHNSHARLKYDLRHALIMEETHSFDFNIHLYLKLSTKCSNIKSTSMKISDLSVNSQKTLKWLFFFFFFFFEGAQWLSGRVLDSRPKGRGFEPHRRHCVVVLEQDTFILA